MMICKIIINKPHKENTRTHLFLKHEKDGANASAIIKMIKCAKMGKKILK